MKQSDKSTESQTLAHAGSVKAAAGYGAKASIADNRPVAAAQLQLAGLVEQSPRIVAQRALLDGVHGSPQMAAQRAQMASIAGDAVQRRSADGEDLLQPKAETAPNRTGMPEQLKAGIESLSGMDMSDVRVHANSDKPAQLNALAYAQGNDIHLAPGQEQHLPHEAWHVVQQRQGRVNATRQMAGVAVNDDKGLEAEADVMGARALAAGGQQADVAQREEKGAHSAASGHVVQRDIAWKDDNHPNKTLDAFATALNTEVQLGATAALTPEDLTGVDGYTALWKTTAQLVMAYRDGNIDEGDVAAAKTAAKFAPARYGYAVEAYANAQKDTLQEALPGDYTFTIQGSRGMTRPDFIVHDDDETEVGWFDITSAGSLGHIDKKTGSGWKNKPYVAEITYPALNADNLTTSGSSIGERVKARNSAKRIREQWDNHVKKLRDHFILLYESYRDKSGLNATKENKREWAKDALNIVFIRHLVKNAMAKDLLRALGETPSQYAFDSGGSKAEGETVLREYLE